MTIITWKYTWALVIHFLIIIMHKRRSNAEKSKSKYEPLFNILDNNYLTASVQKKYSIRQKRWCGKVK